MISIQDRMRNGIDVLDPELLAYTVPYIYINIFDNILRVLIFGSCPDV